MTPPGKSAALRLPPYRDDAPDAGFEAAIRNTAAARAAARPSQTATTEASARDKLLAFPGFEPSRSSARATPAAPETVAESDLGAELEAALMSDLQSMVALFDEVARDPEPPVVAPPVLAPPVEAPPVLAAREPYEPLPPRASRPASAAPAAEDGDSDREALERLLASIRQGDGAPRREALPPEVLDSPIVFSVDELRADARDDRAERRADPLPKRDQASPRPGAVSDRLAPPVPRARKASTAKPAARAKITSKAEPAPAIRLALPGAHRAYLKPAIAISALILLATIGAGMTIRALTARNDTAPALAETVTPAAADSAPSAAPPTAEAAPVVKSETKAVADATLPDTTAAGAVQPAADTPRLAVDNSLAPATVPVAEAAPVSEAPAAETAVAEAPAAPAPRVALEPIVAANPAENETFQPSVIDGGATPPTESAARTSDAPATAVTAKPVAMAPSTGGSASGATGGLPPGAARIASGVNLRSNPDNGAPVIGVLTQGTAVTVVGCKGWCEIVAGDKRGFVYQKFLATAGG